MGMLPHDKDSNDPNNNDALQFEVAKDVRLVMVRQDKHILSLEETEEVWIVAGRGVGEAATRFKGPQASFLGSPK